MYRDSFWAVTADPNQLSLDRLSGINLDNFSRHFFSWAYAGVTDYCQGVAVLEDSPGAQLYWINWDMDHGFYDYTAETRQLERENWQQEGVAIIYRNNHDCGRTKLFSRLVNEDQEYRRYFIELSTWLMNHELTRSFLFERVSYYGKMLNSFGSPHDQYIAMLTDFMLNRSTFIRSEIADLFQLDGPYRCRLTAPDGVKVLVDGHPEQNGYLGWYFAGQNVTLSLINGTRKQDFAYWQLAGQRFKDRELEIPVSEDLEIQLHMVPGVNEHL